MMRINPGSELRQARSGKSPRTDGSLAVRLICMYLVCHSCSFRPFWFCLAVGVGPGLLHSRDVDIYVCIYIYIYICVHLSLSLHIYIYIYIHIHIGAHTVIPNIPHAWRTVSHMRQDVLHA